MYIVCVYVCVCVCMCVFACVYVYGGVGCSINGVGCSVNGINDQYCFVAELGTLWRLRLDQALH